MQYVDQGQGQDGQPRKQIDAAPAMDVELAALQGSQQRLVSGVEDVHALDRRIPAHTWPAQPLQITLARAEVVQAGQEGEVALFADQQDLAKVDRAVNRLLQKRQLARGLRENLSQTFTLAAPMQCLMQRPSMCVGSRESISCISVGVIFLPRKPATRGASAASTAWRDSVPCSVTRMSRPRNNQPRRVAACCEHAGHEVFLADAALADAALVDVDLADEPDLDASGRADLPGALANALAQRFGKARVVEDADAARVQKARHCAGVTRSWQRAGDDDLVAARQHDSTPCRFAAHHSVSPVAAMVADLASGGSTRVLPVRFRLCWLRQGARGRKLKSAVGQVRGS